MTGSAAGSAGLSRLALSECVLCCRLPLHELWVIFSWLLELYIRLDRWAATEHVWTYVRLCGATMSRAALIKLFIIVILTFIICLPEFFTLYRGGSPKRCSVRSCVHMWTVTFVSGLKLKVSLSSFTFKKGTKLLFSWVTLSCLFLSLWFNLFFFPRSLCLR